MSVPVPAPVPTRGDTGSRGGGRCGCWPDRSHRAPAVGRSVEGDRAAVEHDDATGEGEDPAELLLHDEHRRARGEDAVEHGVDLGGADRVEAERQLVGHEHPGLERQDTGEGEDALLAPRQRAGELAAALAQAGEGREGLVEDAGPTAPPEAAALGPLGPLLLSVLYGDFSLAVLHEAVVNTLKENRLIGAVARAEVLNLFSEAIAASTSPIIACGRASPRCCASARPSMIGGKAGPELTNTRRTPSGRGRGKMPPPAGTGVAAPRVTWTFHPYSTAKEWVGIGVFLIFCAVIVFCVPNICGEPANYIEANPLNSPPRIVPEWYFLPFYAILRAITFDIWFIPAKLIGVVLMFGSIIVLFFLPWLDRSPVRSSSYSSVSRRRARKSVDSTDGRDMPSRSPISR